MERPFEVALFDLDGVVFDTEGQYSVFWGGQCRRYHPDRPGIESLVKGQTLVQIFSRYFPGMDRERAEITRRLDEFEAGMEFSYVAGFEGFVADIRRRGVRTAIVTSSNRRKMGAVYAAHPELPGLFDAILTSEDFARSKPDPDCYLRGAGRLGARCGACVVFEDSINGLRSGRAAGMRVVGLSTTNPREVIAPLADCVIPDFRGLDLGALGAILDAG